MAALAIISGTRIPQRVSPAMASAWSHLGWYVGNHSRMGRTRAHASNFCGRTPAIFLYPTIGGLAASLPAKARRLYRLPRGVARYASLHIDRHELLGWLDSDDLVDEPHTSGPAILGCPLIWRQWPVGYDVLTNVAIVVMRLVGLLLAVLRESPRAREPWSCVILVW